MMELSIDGISLRYRVAGAGPRWLVLVHAYPTHSDMWEPQIGALTAGRTVVTYDVRGFGASSAPDDARCYSQERSVEDLLCLIDHLGLERPDICGLSMGGNIALNFALAHPHRVSSLIISGTGSGSDDRAPFVAMVEGWATTAERDGIEAFADLVMTYPVFSQYAERGGAERERLRRLISANSVPGVAHTAREVLAKRPPIMALEDRMRRLPTRTLIIAGARDEAVAASTAAMARALPDARLSIIPETGHFNNLEEPETVNQLLISFFDAS